ncbi:uncharacterized protein LOC128238092 [Mya arenaria]|uniref:uncharacterized protein LOC128238092 n=1 Tax=Mya arenaria TaxID=6604 RepID=UPI0022E062EE|nr:uncharacterized protein LOC128238092 [Mya arenaria]
MAPLPASRVQESNAFARTGVDYLGPLYVKAPEGSKKVWVCLFSCMVTRAIHLELVQDMTTEEFLLALKRFVSQRGVPSEILSDNANQFKLANKTLDEIWKNVTNSSEVQSYTSSSGINWHFIVELAPWMGGFYERLVGLVKRSLRKSLGRKLLTTIQLQTLLKEIESVVNSRPLVYITDDLSSNITLTPSHFLTPNPKTGIPEISVESDDTDYSPYDSSCERLLNIWKKGQKLLDDFWRIWRDEYQCSLRERTQTFLKAGRVVSHNVPRIGDTVLIKDNTPRGSWKIGRVQELVHSRDNEIRSAKVQLSSKKVLGRPLNSLYPVECNDIFKQTPGTDRPPEQRDKITKQCTKRPVRLAAEAAKRKIKTLV